VLARHLDSPLAPLAFHALALAPGPDARTAIARRLDAADASSTWALRAAAFRILTLGERLPDAPSRASALLTSDDPNERAAAATLLVALEPDWLPTLLSGDDPDVVRAAARWSALHPTGAVAAAGELRRGRPRAVAEALAVCLALPEARKRVPTARLLELIAWRGPAAPLAALALAERDHEETEWEVLELLRSPSSHVRAQVAVGLGTRTESRALAFIERAYRAETDPSVRLALVDAAARRPEPSRRRLLHLAATLDPDRAVRSRAVLAVERPPLPAPRDDRGGLWIWATPTAAGPNAVLATLPTLQVLPYFADPDGHIIAGYLPRGPVDVRVASGAGRRQSEPRGKHEALTKKK
jgi:hypothetical protein